MGALGQYEARHDQKEVYSQGFRCGKWHGVANNMEANQIQSDMDEEPALRLWWEYLECVDWRKDFYDLLVTLQGRNPGSYLQ